VSIDLHLSDAMVDMIGDGFDAAIRIAVLPDSSLIARRLCGMPRYLVGSPTYLKKHGRSPVRRLKRAWCHGHRTVSSTIIPSARGPP
jgi:hypothetical protein